MVVRGGGGVAAEKLNNKGAWEKNKKVDYYTKNVVKHLRRTFFGLVTLKTTPPPPSRFGSQEKKSQRWWGTKEMHNIYP